MIPRWDPSEGGRLHSEDIKSTDALHWLHHSSVSSLYLCICVFVCIFLCTVLMIRLQICWYTTFTASTLYHHEYRQWRALCAVQCAHLSQMEWILFKCRVSQLRGRKEGKEITDATVSHLTQLLRTILTGGAYICCVRCNQNSFKCRDKSHSELQTFCICIGICVFV